MKLTVLGCSGSVPGPASPASGYLVEAEGFLLAMDFGNGVLASLHAVHDPFDLDAVLLSHLHPDHCIDLGLLAVMLRYHTHPPYDTMQQRLPVHAPSEAPTRLAFGHAPDSHHLAETNLSDIYDFVPLKDGTVHIGPFEVASARVAHPPESYGFRVTYQGVSLAYTGDSGPCEALERLAAGVDVLLAEASWTHAADRPAGLHMSGREAGELAAAAGVGRLLLTHVPPWTDADAVLAEARRAYQGPVELVAKGSVYAIGERHGG